MIKKRKALKLSEVTLPKDYDMRRDGISQSLLSHFPLCRLRFLLKVNRWKKAENDTFVLFGNIVHHVFEKVYAKGKFPSKKKIEKLVDDYAEQESDTLSQAALERLPLESDKAIIILWEYFKYYRKDFKQIKFEKVEEIFETEFFGFLLRGKKDTIIKTKYREMMEHKTKGRVQEDILENVLNFDFQNLLYITCEEIDGDKLSRVKYNIVRNPGIKQGAKESLKDYLNRLKKDIQQRPDFYFIRYDVKYLESDKKIFREELKHKLEEADKFLKGELPLYRNQQACQVPFRCEFLEACGSGNLLGYVQGDTLFPELK